MGKNSFHIAKLSLFNMRLLSEVEDASHCHHDIKALKSEQCRLNNVSEPVSLLHQTSFLGHAYVCLVWLRECVKKNTQDERAYLETLDSFDFSSFKKVSGPRDLTKQRQILRLIRNAISDARVTFSDSYFIFSDIDEKAGEREETVVRGTWQAVGMLADTSLFAVNDIVYPPNK
ncbi:MAG: hypothetical protein JRJ86_19740 [Deltaproteobacteria bacterium]|nr:hypothetical protein [Deltaproteobacteria bacterium]